MCGARGVRAPVGGDSGQKCNNRKNIERGFISNICAQAATGVPRPTLQAAGAPLGTAAERRGQCRAPSFPRRTFRAALAAAAARQRCDASPRGCAPAAARCRSRHSAPRSHRALDGKKSTESRMAKKACQSTASRTLRRSTARSHATGRSPITPSPTAARVAPRSSTCRHVSTACCRSAVPTCTCSKLPTISASRRAPTLAATSAISSTPCLLAVPESPSSWLG